MPNNNNEVMHMRNPIRQLIEFEGLPVLTPTYGTPYHYYTVYLSNNRDLLNAMLARHSKVLFLRFDLRFPEAYCWPEPISYLLRFLDCYRRWLVEHDFDPQYGIRMEKMTSANPHFHVALLLNGNNANAGHAWFYKQQAENCWLKAVGECTVGLVDYCHRDYRGASLPEGTLVIRPPQWTGIEVQTTPEYQEVFKAMSYLAKYVPEDQILSSQRKVFYSLCNRIDSRGA